MASFGSLKRLGRLMSWNAMVVLLREQFVTWQVVALTDSCFLLASSQLCPM